MRGEMRHSYSRPLALITGACGGMGLACARRLGASLDLILTDIRRQRLDATVEVLREEGYVIAAAAAGDIADGHTLDALGATVPHGGACAHWSIPPHFRPPSRIGETSSGSISWAPTDCCAPWNRWSGQVRLLC